MTRNELVSKPLRYAQDELARLHTGDRARLILRMDVNAEVRRHGANYDRRAFGYVDRTSGF
jgi:hypothetical protein